MDQNTVTKFIAEIGCNHQGDLDIARRMIDEIAGLGLWAVKFQKRDPDSIPEWQKKQPRDPSNSFGKDFYEHRLALEFTVGKIKELKQYAETKGLFPIVSVFDMKSARQMLELKFQYIKLPSQFYSHYALNLLLFDAQMNPLDKNRPGIIVSTGMHTFKELVRWQFFDRAEIMLYCRSIYPFEQKDLDIEYAKTLRAKLQYSRFGFSSHDKNGESIPIMVMLGAEYVERHFTLDKDMKGSDHATVSSDIAEMRNIIANVKKVEAAMRFENKEELANETECKMRTVYRGI